MPRLLSDVVGTVLLSCCLVSSAIAQSLPNVVPDHRRTSSSDIIDLASGRLKGHLWVATKSGSTGSHFGGYKPDNQAFAGFSVTSFVPTSVACITDSLLVAVRSTGSPCATTWRVYTHSGTQTASVTPSDLTSCVIDAAVGPDSLLYLLTDAAEVYVYHPTSGSTKVRSFNAANPSASSSTPSALTLDVNGTVIVAVDDQLSGGSSITLRSWYPTGTQRYTPIALSALPTAIAADHSGNVFAMYTPEGATNHDALIVYKPSDGSTVLSQQLRSPHTFVSNGVATDPTCGVFASLDSSGSFHIRRLQSDKDGDGLCDSWELHGLQVGIDQSNWQLPDHRTTHSINHKDLYLEVDITENMQLYSGVLDSVAAVLLEAESDSLIPPNPDNADGIALQDFVSDEDLPETHWRLGFWASQFDPLKRTWFGTSSQRSQGNSAQLMAARERVYRYAILGDTITRLFTKDKRGPIHGLSKNLGCRDFVVGLGHATYGSTPDLPFGDRRQQQHVFLHELGHAMGLRHGGMDPLDGKPNYRSAMNVRWYPDPENIALRRLQLSTRPYNLLDENSLTETAGIGGVPGLEVLISRPADARKRKRVRETNAIDWNEDGDTTDTGVQAAWLDYERGSRKKLHSTADWRWLRVSPANNDTAVAGPSAEAELICPGEDQIEQALSTYCDCNRNGRADWIDVYTGASDDGDSDGVPNECDFERVMSNDDVVIACPAGHEPLSITADVSKWCVYDTITALTVGSGRLRGIVARQTGSTVTLWTESGVPTDTMFSHAGNPSEGTFVLSHGRLTGHGGVKVTVYLDDFVVGESPVIEVRGFDFDASAYPAVDQYDAAALASRVGYNTPLHMDFDEDGNITSDDVEYFNDHLGHSGHRELVAPNGGQVFTYGDVTTVTWVRGYGAQARVRLLQTRLSDPSGHLVTTDVPDTGSYSWTVLSPDAPASDYLFHVVHTAGNYSGAAGNIVGEEVSDATHTVNVPPGGSCPFVDTRSGADWVVENSILARSRTGALNGDVYRLRVPPTVSEGRYHVRLRENEQESTTLDRVALVTVDHGHDVRAFAGERGPVVGTKRPAYRVRTSAGVDITGLVSGGTGHFAGGPGDTLLVDYYEPGQFARIGRVAGMGEGGGTMGGDEKGNAPQFRATPTAGISEADEARRIDEEVLENTGILIQVSMGNGNWRTVKHYYPREFADEAVIDSIGTDPVRMIFVGRHRLRFIGGFDPAEQPGVQTPCELASAHHSRLGNAMNAVASEGGSTTNLSPGDTLTLGFVAPPLAEGRTREWFLVTRGVYTAMRSEAPGATARTLPTQFALRQNQPNPFGALTSIRFELPKPSKVSIEVFDLQGRKVETLVDEERQAGFHVVEWDRRSAAGASVAPGVYMYRMTAGSFTKQHKMVILP